MTEKSNPARKRAPTVNGAAGLKAKPAVRKTGRPSLYTPQLVEEICLRLGKAEPLAVICRDDHMPNDDTVRDWAEKDEAVKRAIARAREVGHDFMAAECLRIADDGRNDSYTDEEGNVRVDTDVIQRSKLRIETRLKLLAKWDPKRYGEKVALTGGDGGPLQIQAIERRIVDPAE